MSGYLDRSGNWAISPRFAVAGDFSEDLAPIGVEHRKWGYIDKTGTLVIPALYYSAGSFTEGLAPVRDGMLFMGYINRQGKLVIPIQFEHAEPFKSGLAAVGNFSGLGIIGRSGKYVAGPFRDREPR